MSQPLQSWSPSLSAPQFDVYNARDQILLVDGPRFASKSWACAHKVVRHLWETPHGLYGIFAKSVKLAKDAGSWQLLLEHILPEWLNAKLVGKTGLELEILSRNADGNPGPKVDSNTRTAYFDIRNYYGGRSRCMLFSINNENEIEEKIKNKHFSGMWFIELSMWKERKILPITLASLRMPGLSKYEDNFLQWMADTNPDETLGKNSWIYQVFYVERNQPPQEGEGSLEQELLGEYYRLMRVITLHWKDNPYFTRTQRVRLLGSCRGDPALKEAYYEGVWGSGGYQSRYHFRNLFLPTKHVVGGGIEEGDQIDVTPSSTLLKSGWDIGSVNHAVVLLDKWFRPIERTINGKKEVVQLPCWSVLDEIVHIGSGLSHEQCINLDLFTQWVLEAMHGVETAAGRKFEWEHDADDSALTVFRPGSPHAYDYLEILKASQGRIRLTGVHKPNHSRQARVRAISILLQEQRLFVSARCKRVIAMFENLAQGNPVSGVISHRSYIVDSDHRHVFDALSYPIWKEMQAEMLEEAFSPRASQREGEEQAEEEGIVSI